ncbi:MAG: hypothetical protein M1285_01720 [Candidatus Thermoplasmatota archaeon]|jgi:hypothetical protein|nr:hypothetical protein [Candidatus Thermoplasmatota archaeon]
MIRHNDVKQSSLSEFSDAKDRERYNSITSTHSILTSYDKRPKSSEYPPSEWTSMTRSMKYCSRFESCPTMRCPLDPQINGRMPYDPELDGEFKDSVCTMAKATRHRYWEAMPEDLRDALPFQGYFEGEYRRITKARERWESLTDEQRTAVRDRMRAIQEGKMK